MTLRLLWAVLAAICAVHADRAVRIIQTELVYLPQLFPLHLAVQVRKQP